MISKGLIFKIYKELKTIQYQKQTTEIKNDQNT